MFKTIFLCVRLLLRWQNAISFAASNSNLPAFRRFDMTTWIIHLNPPQKQEQQQAETDSATRNARKVQCTQPQNPDFDQLKKKRRRFGGESGWKTRRSRGSYRKCFWPKEQQLCNNVSRFAFSTLYFLRRRFLKD